MIEDQSESDLGEQMRSGGARPDSERYDPAYLVAVLLVFVAKGDGDISEMEMQKMLSLIEQHFGLPSAAGLSLLTRAMSDLADRPDIEDRLRKLSANLSLKDKERIALMLLNVVAADGRKDVEEMDKMSLATEIIDIPPDSLHRAYERYFDESSEMDYT